jgi:hypothetical protein
MQRREFLKYIAVLPAVSLICVKEVIETPKKIEATVEIKDGPLVRAHWTSEEWQSFMDNPWQIFKPAKILTPISSNQYISTKQEIF